MKNFNKQLGYEAADAEVIKGMRSNYISYIVERDPAMTQEQQAGIIRNLFQTWSLLRIRISKHQVRQTREVRELQRAEQCA